MIDIGIAAPITAPADPNDPACAPYITLYKITIKI